MNREDETARWLDRAAQMRRAFDEAFALPAVPPSEDLDDFLAIHVGARPMALRVAELARVEIGCKIVPLPIEEPWLIGLASTQGRLMPVYDLEAAVGFDQTSGAKGWIAVAGRDEPLGLAFAKLEGYLRVPRGAILDTGGVAASRGHHQRAVRGAGNVWPVVDVPSIVAAVRGRVSARGGVQEF